jgi:signal transduction histidine kinase
MDNRGVRAAFVAAWFAALPRRVVPALAVAGAAATVVALTNLDRVVTTYATASGLAAAATLVAGLALVAAGLIAWLDRPASVFGPLAAAAGLAWLAPVWVGWQAGPSLARSLGMVVAPFLLPLLVHQLISAPTGRLRTRAERLAVTVTYAATAAVSLGRALFRDPFLDRSCWSNCTDNVFLVWPLPELARALDAFWLRFVVVVGVGAVAATAWRLVRATAVARSDMWALVVPAVLAVSSEVAYAVLLALEPIEDPRRAVFHTLFVARGAALTAIALGLSWTVERGRRRRAAIARLAGELGAVPQLGSLQSALARSLGDEKLQVAYWLPRSGRYVDDSGRPVEPESSRHRGITSILRNGEPVAVITHDRSLYGDQQLAEQIGSAARLAIDNERLQAELLAQLGDLRASRARVVETADDARRQLERNLHDGAQQSMLALLYELRIAQVKAAQNGDEPLSDCIGAAVDQAAAAVDDLRSLARGIFPAILDEAGLGPALWTLADQAAVPVEIRQVPADRLPDTVERAAYLVVSGVVESAQRHQAETIQVRITRRPGTVAIHIDGVPEGRYIYLADRVGSVGGELTCTERRLRAEIPCA